MTAVEITNAILECLATYVGPAKAIMLFVLTIAFAITGEMAVLDVCMQMIFSFFKRTRVHN